MTTLSPLTLSDPEWDAFVAGQADGHLLQSSAWGAFKAGDGWGVRRVVVGAGGAPLAGAQMLIRRLPLGLRLAYIPKGPVGPWWEPAIAKSLFPALDEAAKAAGAFLLKVEPEARQSDELAAALSSAGFSPSEQTVQPRATIWIDLLAAEEDILARMKSKTRYNIRLAGRKEVEVRDGRPEDLPAFYALMQETSRRDGFAVHPEEYYRRAYALFVGQDMGRLFLAWHGETLLAGIMVFAFAGKAWYMYGASSSVGRERMPNHALQWAAICWARQRGCRHYDLWGIPDEVGSDPDRYSSTATERSDGLWGVYRFKQGFGGAVSPGDASHLPAFYALYAETSARDGFLIREYDYYRSVWERFLARGYGHLLLASVEGEIVAGLFLFLFGRRAWYMYGASGEQHRNLMPNYLLQWEAMRLARAQACTAYDMWGAPDELVETDPMWGVYRFKAGFGGEFVRHIGAYDYPTSAPLYRLYMQAIPRYLALLRRLRGTGTELR